MEATHTIAVVEGTESATETGRRIGVGAVGIGLGLAGDSALEADIGPERGTDPGEGTAVLEGGIAGPEGDTGHEREDSARRRRRRRRSTRDWTFW